MLAYVTLGTNDLQRACEFYDQLMGSIRVQCRFITQQQGITLLRIMNITRCHALTVDKAIFIDTRNLSLLERPEADHKARS